ncbi:histidine phosphatase family protein [Paenibacillus sp. strain BS8-2]
MKTIVYFVRHAESPYIADMERTRGLSENGVLDSLRVKNILSDTEIDIVISSPYERAIQTIKPLATDLKKEIILFEGLKERTLGEIGEVSFKEAKQKLYSNFQYKYNHGESSEEAQLRAIKELKTILTEYEGKNIVIGSHGDIMTLMMNYFDNQFGNEFWESTTMPDIYKLQFNDYSLKDVQRLWN